MSGARPQTWLGDIISLVEAGASVLRVTVLDTHGSTPRETGANMLVTAAETIGTIGGGALEDDAIRQARDMLTTAAAHWSRAVRHYHLGPELAQCCGGTLRCLFERFGSAEAAALHALTAQGAKAVLRPLRTGAPMAVAREPSTGTKVFATGDDEWLMEPSRPSLTPLVLYGAGHVGRAIVRAFERLPFALTWVDVAADRFPAEADAVGDVLRRIDSEPSRIADQSKPGTFHLVMTHSHALDEAIVAAVLKRDNFGYLGLIGSATKRARFTQRLVRSGIDRATIDRLTCPIGLPGLAGKEPAVIAASVAADLLLRRAR